MRSGAGAGAGAGEAGARADVAQASAAATSSDSAHRRGSNTTTSPRYVRHASEHKKSDHAHAPVSVTPSRGFFLSVRSPIPANGNDPAAPRRWLRDQQAVVPGNSGEAERDTNDFIGLRLLAHPEDRGYSAALKEVPMKKLLTTLMLTAFMASGTAAMAGAAAEKDTKAGKDKPAAKEEKSAPAPKADDKAAGDKKEKK